MSWLMTIGQAIPPRVLAVAEGAVLVSAAAGITYTGNWLGMNDLGVWGPTITAAFAVMAHFLRHLIAAAWTSASLPGDPDHPAG